MDLDGSFNPRQIHYFKTMLADFEEQLTKLVNDDTFCRNATELSQFKGFDPERYKQIVSKDEMKLTLEIAVAGAMMGSNWKKQNMSVQNSLRALGYTEDWTIDKANAKTILRTTNVFANYVVAIIGKNESLLQERFPGKGLPKALQFPGAAALSMGQNCRAMHIEFCKHFSSLLPQGSFNAEIYEAMSKNKLQPVKGTSQSLLNYLSR
jgi:hypothetical protein